METAIYQQAIEAATDNRDLLITPVTSGLINKTFKVEVEHSGETFLLQQINTEVFTDPAAVQDNYRNIWQHLQHTDNPVATEFPVVIPAPLQFSDGSLLFSDRHRRHWRIFEFIEHAQTQKTPSNIVQAKRVAQTFGSVTAHFSDYDLSTLHTTVRGFHDLSLRYDQFKAAWRIKNYERLQKSAGVIEDLRKREHYVSFYEVMTASDEFRQRLMHHDAKISNVLFNESTGQLICPVDFDTCMPGYFFSDLGDMIRSMASNGDENFTNTDHLDIREDYYTAILEGYLDALEPELTSSEKKYIHYAGLLVIYMQTLRFITDYLENDKYYRTDRPDHNLHRAANQLTLLQALESFLRKKYNFLNK